MDLANCLVTAISNGSTVHFMWKIIWHYWNEQNTPFLNTLSWKTKVKTLKFPVGKLASWANTMVKTIHLRSIRWHANPKMDCITISGNIGKF